jgi:uncharacterized repeat protein (TIGR04138 family)
MCAFARSKYGLLAYDVLKSWGAATPLDIGLAVFQLLEAGILSKQESDQLQDFDIELDLRQAIEDAYFG